MQGSDLTLDRATLASAVHDLRNPLAVIVGMASVLRARAMPRDRDCLDAISTECNRLARMVDNLMAAARIGDLPPQREWIPADELASAAIERLEGLAPGTSVALEIQNGVLIHIEPVLGELLLVNLLEYLASPREGRLELSISRSNGAVSIEVHGTAASTVARDALELLIPRHIVHAHGGTLEKLEPEAGGALVRATLPDGAPRPEVTP